MAIYFYMRISTQEERGLQKFSRQENALRKYAETNGLQFDEHNIYKEDRSGKNFNDREEWHKLEDILHSDDMIVFKDISRFTREAENGYQKYMTLYDKGVHLLFLDNQTVCTDYIHQLLDVAEKQNLIAKISLENTVKLLLYVELDRVEQERLTLQKRIKDGIAASEKSSGRKKGHFDKLTPELEIDLQLYLNDRTILQIDVMKKHGISRNTFKKYLAYIKKSKEIADAGKEA
ncbi:MAG: recombinase family protein [Lachnospiraceae bacterium]|nr:recombinase family protein [Lachnospiraceae bacterium]